MYEIYLLQRCWSWFRKDQKVKSCRRTCFHRNTVDQKLNKDDKAWALDKTGFKRVSDNLPVDLSKISDDDMGLYYKDAPYTPHTLQQRLIITYSPKYARYQKTIRSAQVERAENMIHSGNVKKNVKSQ